MIILKNSPDIQLFRILKNNPTYKSVPRRFQSKDYLANKIGTFEILPDEGYYAMTSVNLDVDFTTDSKSETYTENGEYQILPNEDSVGLSDVTITVDVQPPLQDKQVTYNEVGTYNVEADEGYYGLDNVEITFEYPLEEVTDTITENGTYTYEPSEGYKGISKVDIEVSTSGLPIDLQSIGWTQSDIDTYVEPLAAGVEYAKTIQDKWIPSAMSSLANKYYGNTQITFFPNVDCSFVTLANGTFQNSTLVNIPASLNFTRVREMVNTFNGCRSLSKIDMSQWKFADGCYFNNTFTNSGVTEVTLPTCKPYDVNYMFYNCTTLRTIKGLENMDMSNCVNMNSMFYGCNALSTYDFSSWNTSKCPKFYQMFYSVNNGSIPQLNLSNWDFNSVTTSNYSGGVYNMFAFATSIKSINLTNAKMDKMGSMANMWYYSYATEIILDGVTLPKVAMDWDSSYAHKHTLETVLGILNALPDITGDGLSLTCKLGTQDLAQLTDEQKAIGTSKGWTLA